MKIGIMGVIAGLVLTGINLPALADDNGPLAAYLTGFDYQARKGIDSRYLVDGLIGLSENLRGDHAKALIDILDGLEN